MKKCSYRISRLAAVIFAKGRRSILPAAFLALAFIVLQRPGKAGQAAASPSSSQPAFAAKSPAPPKSVASAGPISFEDVIETSGIKFELKNSISPQRYSIETMLGGVAVFDYNNDGLLDIFFTNGAAIPSLEKSDPGYYNRLYRNNGDGTFTDVTERAGVKGVGYSMGVAAGDFDNDGFRSDGPTPATTIASIEITVTAHLPT